MSGWGNRTEWEVHIDIGGKDMLWALCTALMLLWLVGLISAYTLGGFIHVLLILAVVVTLIQVIQQIRTPAV